MRIDLLETVFACYRGILWRLPSQYDDKVSSTLVDIMTESVTPLHGAPSKIMMSNFGFECFDEVFVLLRTKKFAWVWWVDAAWNDAEVFDVSFLDVFFVVSRSSVRKLESH